MGHSTVSWLPVNYSVAKGLNKLVIIIPFLIYSKEIYFKKIIIKLTGIIGDMLEYNEHSNTIAKFENKVVMLHNTL